jgi:hypothetical protein
LKRSSLRFVVGGKVGTDTMHTDPHPVTKMPKWIEEIIKDRDDEKERREKERERERNKRP